MSRHYERDRGGPVRAGEETAGERYRRRRDRRRRALPAGGPTLELVSDHECLIDAYRRLEAEGGHAPGPDGVSYADLGPTEVAIVMREAADAVRRGAYRPGGSRKVPIPKSAGGTRVLTVSNLVDRAVAKAVADALTPTFERVFLPPSFGFRPGRGAQDLLADLLAVKASLRITTLAIEDVKSAFDTVQIAPLLENFAGHVKDAGLLTLIETVLRGGEDRGRALGIPQGNPLSRRASL